MTVFDLQTPANSLACQAGLRTVSLTIFPVNQCDTIVHCAHGESTVVVHVTWCRKAAAGARDRHRLPMARLPMDVSARIQWIGCSGRQPNFCLPHPKQFGETLGCCKGRVNKHARSGIIIILLSSPDYWVFGFG